MFMIPNDPHVFHPGIHHSPPFPNPTLIFPLPGGITLPTTLRTSLVYNRTLALYLVEHASAVYVDSEADLVAWNCSRCQGVTTGFHNVTVIVDEPKILQVGGGKRGPALLFSNEQ